MHAYENFLTPRIAKVAMSKCWGTVSFILSGSLLSMSLSYKTPPGGNNNNIEQGLF